MVFLLYPLTGSVKDLTEPITYRSADHVTVRICCVNLMDMAASIQEIAKQIDGIMR